MQYFSDMSVNPLLASGLVAGVLAGVSCGVMGPYVIVRRIVFLSGAIAHFAVGGVGAAIFLRHRMPGLAMVFDPFYGAVAAAVAGAVLIGLAHARVRERLDTLIGAMWAVGMSVGLLLVKLTPGYYPELMSYLFGNVSMVSWDDAIRIAVLIVVLLVAVGVFHKRILAVCLDEQFATLQHVSPTGTNLILLVLVALTVVTLMQIVGLILVIAMLTLPAAAVSQHVGRMGSLIVGSVLVCICLTTVPRVAVYGSAVSPEAAIVLAAGVVYLGSVGVARMRGIGR